MSHLGSRAGIQRDHTPAPGVIPWRVSSLPTPHAVPTEECLISLVQMAWELLPYHRSTIA